MKKITAIVAVVILIIAGGLIWHAEVAKAPKDEKNNQPPVQAEVVISSPVENQAISSPVEISGKAKGSWFFEAVFPIKILDQDGTELGSGQAQAQGNWQTTDYVNFTSKIVFLHPKGLTGTILFENDNPSGLPQNHKEFKLPIKFDQTVSKQPSGTCAPNTACASNPQLCLEDNLNQACN